MLDIPLTRRGSQKKMLRPLLTARYVIRCLQRQKPTLSPPPPPEMLATSRNNYSDPSGRTSSKSPSVRSSSQKPINFHRHLQRSPDRTQEADERSLRPTIAYHWALLNTTSYYFRNDADQSVHHLVNLVKKPGTLVSVSYGGVGRKNDKT